MLEYEKRLETLKLPNLEAGSEASVRLHRTETMDSTPETHRKERKKLVLRLLEIHNDPEILV